MAEPSLWIVGDWRHADFSAPLAWISERASCAPFDDPLAAMNSHQHELTAILLVQSRPAQFSKEQVERLHAAAPLARLVALIGPWCEGELRTGQPWPGVMRVPWRAWRARLGMELGLAGRNGSLGALFPRTVTETERIDHATRSLTPAMSGQGKAVICTERKDRFDSVADALALLGWKLTGPVDSVCQTDVLISDGWDQVKEDAQAVGARRVLLLDFPRPDDHERAAAMGIYMVVGLPLLLADLAMAMDRPQNSPS